MTVAKAGYAEHHLLARYWKGSVEFNDEQLR